MKIRVKEKDKRGIRLWVPNSIFTNRFVIGQINKHANGYLSIPPSSVRSLRKALRKFKRKHRNFVFVEVKSKDGEEVTIKL